MEPTKKRILGYHYSARGKTFHIVVRLRDVPGALSTVLELLRDRADIIGSVSYGTNGGGAIWSGFVKPLSKNETESKLKNLVEKSPMVKEAKVAGSDRGLLTDSFHSGIEYGPGRFGVILPLLGISSMFNRLVDVFQSGGKTILFEEGSALGVSTGRYLDSLLGSGDIDWKVGALTSIYRGVGWGATSLVVRRPGAEYVVRVRDCFECVDGGRSRRECGFIRGHLTSAVATLSGSEFKGVETKCRLREDPICEFRVTKKN